MNSSNWIGPNIRGGDNPNVANGNNRYRIDTFGLQQLGAGLPLQMLGLEGLGLPLQLQEGMRGLGLSSSGTNSVGFASGSNSEDQSSDMEIKQTVDGIPIRKLYITNIAADFTYNDICYMFGKFGEVYHIFLGTSRNDSFVKKQFAFVTYRNPKDATKVLKIGKLKDYRRRLIYVAAADSWHQPKEGPNGEIIMPPRYPDTKQQDESISEEEDSGAVENLVAAVQVEEGGLNALNDDCLLHIFSFLSYKEIIGVERVCKRWQGLSYRMWKCLHELNLTKAPFNKVKMTTPILEQHLKRCGESLTLLELSGKTNSYNEAALAIIAKYCANLEVLRVENMVLGNRCLAHLGRCCTKLKNLSIDHCVKFKDNDLMSLLPRCHQLSELSLCQSNDISGKFLGNIQGPITSLKIHKCPSIKVEHLIAGVQKMSATLQNLSLTGCGQNRVNELLLAVPNLTSLSLCRPSHAYTTMESPTSIGRLAKLTCLDLTQNTLVNNKVITTIVEGCEELTHLNLSCAGSSFSENLTEEGLSTLGRLRKLTHLELSYLDVTTDSVLKNITTRNTRLKELVCRGCLEIGDDGCSQVVSMCNDLELFDLSGCDVGEPTRSAALTSVKMRTNNVHLRLVMGGTKLESAELPEGTEPSQLLTIDMNDLSDENMRPDNLMFLPSDDFSDDEEDMDNLCCDCDFEYDDLFDPTLNPYLYDGDDDSPKFGGYDDDYDEDGLENWTDDEDNDDEVYAFQMSNN